MSSYSINNYGKTNVSKLVVILISTLLAVLVVAAIGVRKVYFDHLEPVSSSQRAQLITIPKGASAKEIASILEESQVIKAAWAFEWYVRNNGLREELKAGAFYVRPNQTTPEIAAILAHGVLESDLITILPAQRLGQIRDALIQSGFAESVVDQALEPTQYKGHPSLVDKPVGASLEGYLYPESFHIDATVGPEDIIKQSLDQMQKHLTPELRAAIVNQGLTVHEGVKLASIIEQEVSSPQDRKTVAQVFLKRLRQDMALQSDPTAIYGAIKDGINLPSDPARAAATAIAHESAHNTYKNPGLPPTPISNVSKSSLEAVAFPSKTDYLFFVAGDDGKTHFSATLEEHESNIHKYCNKLCS